MRISDWIQTCALPIYQLIQWRSVTVRGIEIPTFIVHHAEWINTSVCGLFHMATIETKAESTSIHQPGRITIAAGDCRNIKPVTGMDPTVKPPRSEERRVGKECDRTCNSGRSRYN